VRVVVDTNVLISALLSGSSPPAQIVTLWREGGFELLTSQEQLDELARVTRYPKIRERLSPVLAGRLVNELRDVAMMVADLPPVTACTDPYDNFLLAMIVAGRADHLVTGDKRDLLSMVRYEGGRIIAVRDFLAMFGRLPRDESA